MVTEERKNLFGKWFRIPLEESGIVHRKLAEKAGISPVSLSRILSGEHGVAKETATALINALNEMVGREIADLETGERLAVGFSEKTVNSKVPKVILEALAREGELRPNDEILIADFITRLKQAQ